MPADIRLFTLEEANALARELAPGLGRLIELRARLAELDLKGEVLGLTVSAGGTAQNAEARELRELQARRTAIATELTEGVRLIHDRGCLLKDLESGLLDFYTLVGDRLVFLCWKLGEPEITHWHTLQSGFSGRQPLSRIHEIE
jgi:hypothetical protein